MLFNPEAIREKTQHLDSILSRPDLVDQVLAANLTGPIQVKNVPRVWEPGGGATLFEVVDGTRPLFLKVKRISVLVESKLESEKAFSAEPSLRNEAAFMKSLNVDWVPRLQFYEEREGYSFLAVEKLDTIDNALRNLSAEDLVRVWERIEQHVRTLFEMGIVHTDIHEKNICFRGKEPVICDFEEARYFQQDCAFEQSLDVVGKSDAGDVGEFPSGKSPVRGLTCLRRLRSVFDIWIRERLPAQLAECKFDDSCPFNRDELQQSDPRVYQSIAIPGLRVRGHRPLHDPRLPVIRAALNVAARDGKLSFLDIGSNLGRFSCMAAALPFVESAIGLEAFEPYVRCANVLRFLHRAEKARFEKFICGEEDLAKLTPKVDFVIMLSVYHHIPNKQQLLNDFRKTGVRYLAAEFATEDRYYRERGSVSKEIDYVQAAIGLNHRFQIGRSLDYRRPLILFSSQPLSAMSRLSLRLTFLGRQFF